MFAYAQHREEPSGRKMKQIPDPSFELAFVVLVKRDKKSSSRDKFWHHGETVQCLYIHPKACDIEWENSLRQLGQELTNTKVSTLHGSVPWSSLAREVYGRARRKAKAKPGPSLLLLFRKRVHTLLPLLGGKQSLATNFLIPLSQRLTADPENGQVPPRRPLWRRCNETPFRLSKDCRTPCIFVSAVSSCFLAALIEERREN